MEESAWNHSGQNVNSSKHLSKPTVWNWTESWRMTDDFTLIGVLSSCQVKFETIDVLESRARLYPGIASHGPQGLWRLVWAQGTPIPSQN